jgi:TRAP-type uncharacterized transport system fused permease subunit
VIAVHLFIVYYAMLSVITPPIATAAFLAGTIAGAPPMQTSFTAMRLGVVIYFVPLFFIFQPALVMQGDLTHLIYVLPSCIIGIALISAGLEGYMQGIGRVNNWLRLPFMLSGFVLSFPTLIATLIGLVASFLLCLISWLQNRKEAKIGQEA